MFAAIDMQTPTGVKFHIKDESVEYAGTPEQVTILDAAAKVYAATLQPLVVTSAADGTHMQGSKHYEHKALDLRVWDVPNHERAAAEIGAILGEDYGVFAEWRDDGETPSHIHAEYDPVS